jgi:hypothetical protein
LPVFLGNKRRGHPDSVAFEMIKQRLDPAFSYVIFERDGPHEKNAWIGLYASLSGLNLPVLELLTFEDTSRGKMFLVAMFEAGRADTIMEKIICARLPRDMVSYVYGSSVHNEGLPDGAFHGKTRSIKAQN